MFNCMPFSKQVESLDRRQCNLNQIPEDVLRYSKSLEELLLDSNHIKEISKHCFRLQKLRRLALSDNEIVKVPADISQLPNLLELDLSKNDISDIPENIKFIKNLQYLDISNNPICRLPSCLTELRALTHLGLSDVSLADLPSDIGKLSNLTVLELRDNVLSKLPQSITFLTRLERLDLGTNELEHLPPEIGKLNSLKELYLDGNSLEELPREIADLKMLQSLDLSENKLLSLPDETGELKNLNDLTLSQNCLEVLPNNIGQLRKLTVLKVDRNRLITLTPAVSGCISLTELILIENLLNELPSSIGNLKELSNLNVDKNRLREIPSTIGCCSNLGVLSFRDNVVQVLPDEIGKLEKLKVLDASGNRLQYLPFTLKNLTDLNALWLSENQSQPILKLQTDQDQRTGVKVLTCYLLPQQDLHAEDGTSHAPLAGNGVVVAQSNVNSGFVGGPKVHFPDVDQESLEEDESTGKFERHDTPHPKHGPKVKGKQIDGHIIPHEGPKKNERIPTVFRIGERKRMNSGSDDGVQSNDISANEVKRQMSPQRVAPPPPQPSRPSVQSNSSYPYPEHESPTAPLADDVYDEPSEDHSSKGPNDDGYKSVNFTSDTHDDPKTRLQRKNTPHPLKQSAMNMDSGAAQEKVAEILARQQQNKAAAPSESVLTRQPSTLVENIIVNGYDLHVEYEQQTIVVHRTDQGLGLSIAGGAGSTPFKEKDNGIFISKITENGASDKAGLKIGDKLLAVNGHSVLTADHARCVELMKIDDRAVSLTIMREILKPTAPSHVRHEPMHSFDESPGYDRATQPPNDLTFTETISTTIKRESGGLGFSIAGGKGNPSWKPGDDAVYVSKINASGPADRSGHLKVGDKILLINGVNIENSRHDQVVSLLTGSSGEVHLVVQREKLATVPVPSMVHAPLPNSGMSTPLKIQTVGVHQQIVNVDDISPLAQSSPLLPHHHKPNSTTEFFIEDVKLVKGNGPLGLSIVGGSDHSSHPFGVQEPGVFVSKVVPDGAAAKTGKLKIGDRILSVNGKDVSKATHQEAVASLISKSNEIWLKIRHDPQPPGLKELTVTRLGDERLGISISGGVATPANPLDPSDEGIFISKITPNGAAHRDGRLQVGVRILEVNNKSMLGASQADAADALRSAGAHIQLLISDGFDAKLIPPSPDLSGSKDESFPSLKDDIFSSPLTPLPTLPSYPVPPVPAPRSAPLKAEAPIMSLHKTPPTPPIRTVVSVLTPENDNLKTFTETAKPERINGQTTFSSVNESKIPTPTKISPPKDLKLTSKAVPSSNVVTTFDDYSPTSSSPTKRPIGIPVPKPYVSKPISTPKPIISPSTSSPSSRAVGSPPGQETSKIPMRTTNDVTSVVNVNGSSNNAKAPPIPHVAPKPPAKTVTLAKPEITPLDTSEIDDSSHLNDSSVVGVDPILQSRIPSAKITQSVSKTPDSPVTPSGESHPEKLSFNRKLERFQHEIQLQNDETQRSKIIPPKKVPLLQRNDVDRLREDESKKFAVAGGQQRLVDSYAMDNVDYYAEEGYEQILESSSSTGPNVVRTKKAENRQKISLPKPGNGAESRLSAAELRKLEADKRAEWRKARLKSLERDALKADQVMAKFREITGSSESLEKQELAYDEHFKNTNGDGHTVDGHRPKSASSNFSDVCADDDDSDADVPVSRPQNGHFNAINSTFQTLSMTTTEKIPSHYSEHRHTEEIGFIDDIEMKSSREHGLNNFDSSKRS